MFTHECFVRFIVFATQTEYVTVLFFVNLFTLLPLNYGAYFFTNLSTIDWTQRRQKFDWSFVLVVFCSKDNGSMRILAMYRWLTALLVLIGYVFCSCHHWDKNDKKQLSDLIQLFGDFPSFWVNLMYFLILLLISFPFNTNSFTLPVR